MTTLKCSIALALLTAVAATPLRAQGQSDSPFSIHGFVTQGVAGADSLPTMGIPTTGTTDYRTVAIQTRYRLDPLSSVVVQISHRRVGESALAALEPELELDWAFYRRGLGPVSVSVGRVPIPRGFYNEVRQVGTLLPFFRAPVSIYADGTEAVDGVTATTLVDLGGWSLEMNAYAGGMEWKGVTSDEHQMYAFAERAERNIGTQLWLGAPVTGVRAGASYIDFEDSSLPGRRGNLWIGSGEIDRDRWMVRSEVLTLKSDAWDARSGYVHGQFRIMPKVHVMAQYEQIDIDLKIPMLFEWTETQDAAVGVAFAPATNVVFKLEGHRLEGYAFDVPMNRFGPAATSNYAILSMSVTF